jgi:hypothetical protein
MTKRQKYIRFNSPFKHTLTYVIKKYLLLNKKIIKISVRLLNSRLGANSCNPKIIFKK